MRFLILSDTHGNYPLAFRALEMAGPIDRIIHLGDGIEDARLIEEITGRDIVKVPGNCDISASDPADISAVFAGKKFFITHGDTYAVKGGLARLSCKARTENAEIVLYGHTHVGSVELLEGTLFVNPGCLRYKWPTASYALIDVDSDGKARAGIHPIEP
jgi:putative phosphoesterase